MSFFKSTNYTGQDSSKKTYKPYYSLKAGVENIYRIAPSCRSLPANDYASFHSVHWGYGVQDAMNPDRIIPKPFECVKKVNYKTKMVDVACAEDLKIDQVTRELAETEAQLAKEGHPRDYIAQATTPMRDWLKAHNLDRKWYCYAKNTAGEWNILKIGHKVKLKIDALMARTYKEDGIKALDPDTGVWFRFTPNGQKGGSADTTVEIVREKVEMNGQRVEVIKSAPLTQIDIDQIETLADVTNCVTVLTPKQIEALVTSGGDPAVATQVFALGQKAEQSTKSVGVPQVTAPSSSTQEPTKTVTSGSVAVASSPGTQGPPSQKTQQMLAMSPDEFLKQFAAK